MAAFKISGLKVIQWSLVVGLGLHLVILVLWFGRQPLLLRQWIYPRAQGGEQGMSLVVDPPGSFGEGRNVLRTTGALARLDFPHTSLRASGIWEVPQAGSYTLSFQCDDFGDVFIDGHRVIRLRGLSSDNRAQAVVPLSAGPHLLVVHLFNGPGRGFFNLDSLGPGQETPAPLPSRQLRPVDLGRAWPGVYWGGAWIRTAWFWAACFLLLLLTLSFRGVTTWRQGGYNALLILAGCLLAGILGEMTARVFFDPPQVVFFKEMTATNPRAGRGDNPFIRPTGRGYRHRPNTEVTVENHPFAPGGRLTFRTNSLGYRNREIGPKNGKRILFLGDSITFGLSMPEEIIFVRRVEDLARQAGEPWETINSAVGGLGLNAELAVLTETGLSLQPDLVVLDFYLNDFQESPGVYIATLPGWLNHSRLAHRLVNVLRAHLFLSATGDHSLGQPMLNTPEGFAAWREVFEQRSTVIGSNPNPDQATRAFHQKVLADFVDWGGAFSPQAWDKMAVLLQELSRLSRQHRFRWAIVAFPVRYQVEAPQRFDYPQRRLADMARSLRVPYLDLLPVYRADYQANRGLKDGIFYDNCHLSVRGHELTAQVFFPFLKQALQAN